MPVCCYDACIRIVNNTESFFKQNDRPSDFNHKVCLIQSIQSKTGMTQEQQHSRRTYADTPKVHTRNTKIDLTK